MWEQGNIFKYEAMYAYGYVWKIYIYIFKNYPITKNHCVALGASPKMNNFWNMNHGETSPILILKSEAS